MAQLQATAVLPAVRLPDDDDDDGGNVHFDSKHGKLTSLGRTYEPGVLTKLVPPDPLLPFFFLFFLFQRFNSHTLARVTTSKTTTELN